jgi:Phage tail sheath protein subtilisin-like domain/Phage tail sheath C-terminal domain
MAIETLISPGVFLRENDLTQIQQGPITVGAALIGPTVGGPVTLPTLVRSYSDYKATFGALIISGGNNYETLTSIAAYNYFQQGGESLLVTRVVSGTFTPASSSVFSSQSGVAFTLETISQGALMNNSGSITNSTSLISGSVNNIRWEVTTADTRSGLFSLIVRRGDDYASQRTVLETWNNLSLDPNQPTFIGYVIGDQITNPRQDEDGNWFLEYTGSYQNKSRYIRVKEVNLTTPGYLGNGGQAVTIYTGSIPSIGSGSIDGAFQGATGAPFTSEGVMNFFTDIPSATLSYDNNAQGLKGSDYDAAIQILKSKDQYDFKTISMPGLTEQNAPTQVAALVKLSEDRGTCISVVDVTSANQSITVATEQAGKLDSSYAATYWPWIQVRSQETGKLVYCPASTVVPAVYEYNDKVSAEWFAPAGLNRGGMTTVVQPERRLTTSQRDTLYANKINPIAVFPGQGTVIYGQKTLQSKASALDRVNVRRLLIALKRHISQISETLLFETNTQSTRNSFINQVNPYLAYVQQKQGLYAFRVVMDDTNNTADIIDRNQLVGQIYLQPTRTVEYILLDFNILPTGATFGS